MDAKLWVTLCDNVQATLTEAHHAGLSLVQTTTLWLQTIQQQPLDQQRNHLTVLITFFVLCMNGSRQSLDAIVIQLLEMAYR
jgi:hypothetical protein